ncbi:MAG: tetratricopeptide repeat protein [Alphaproteobacteria bacterium]|nr:tetratricopeptide repeat protein [Alphaproteobacteria bacterium]
MTDVFEEVEEQVRQDRYAEWTRRYGPSVLAAVAVLVVGYLGWLGFQHWQRSQAQERAGALAEAVRLAGEGDAEQAAQTLERLAGSGPPAFRAMAHMQRAALAEAQGDLTEALQAFDVAASTATDPIQRDTARLRAAYLVAETQDFSALRARVEPIIAEGGAVSFLARELLGIEAWEAGERDLARETFQGIADAFNAPESVRQRAGLALQVIGPAEPAAAAPDAAAQPQPDEGATPAPAAGESE